MNDITWMSWTASVLIFLGNFILIKMKSWKAFVIFLIGNSLFAYYWLVKQEWATLILVCLFIAQNILGIVDWRKKGDRL